MNEYVQSKVGLPGLALAILGMAAIVLNLLGGIVTLVTSMGTILALLDSGDSTSWIAFATNTGWTFVMTLLSFATSFLVAFAGLRLRNARSSGVVYAGAIMAMNPCCFSYCCCIGLPIGIWAIVAMQDEQVKAAFAEQF